jgi:hypothetical protein
MLRPLQPKARLLTPAAPSKPRRAQDDVRRGALVMASSVLLYGFVQVPAFLGAAYDPQARRGPASDRAARSSLPCMRAREGERDALAAAAL